MLSSHHESGSLVGCSLCVKCPNIKAGEKKVIKFSLSWDLPFAYFGTSYLSNPTQGKDGNGENPIKNKQNGNMPKSKKQEEINGDLRLKHYTQFFIPPNNSSNSQIDLNLNVSNHQYPFLSERFSSFQSSFLGRSSPLICSFALRSVERWKQEIDEWQSPILNDDTLPHFYKSMLFNELYFLVDGGSFWVNFPSLTKQSNKNEFDFGKGDSERENENDNGNHTPFSQKNNEQEDDDDGFQVGMIDDFGGEEEEGDMSDFRFGIEEGEESTFQNFLSYLHEFNEEKVFDLMEEYNIQASLSQGSLDVIGEFYYLEGQEYYMYNTYDVHFYASFALLMNWPMIELCIQRMFSRAVFDEDLSQIKRLVDGELQYTKVKYAVPHDLGCPSKLSCNSYCLQDVSNWKDLGPKFILQVMRDYHFVTLDSPPYSFLEDAFPALEAVMNAYSMFDADGDEMIENTGFPDQTYDMWSAEGVSAYTGGLWVAACQSMARICKILEYDDLEASYSQKASKAQLVWNERLWNGSYFSYDTSNSAHSSSIMSDQLAGHFFSLCCDLGGVCLSNEEASTSLRTIFDQNVIQFSTLTGHPKKYDYHQREEQENDVRLDHNYMLLGAVNGMNSSSKSPSSGFVVDQSCMQSREVWTGTTYLLSATMLFQHHINNTTTHNQDSMKLDDEKKENEFGSGGSDRNMNNGVGGGSENELNLREMGFLSMKGIWEAGWNTFGCQFATPEAWLSNGNYRSLSYMRPLAIWGIQYEIQSCQNK